jgi:hypothetical protein
MMDRRAIHEHSRLGRRESKCRLCRDDALDEGEPLGREQRVGHRRTLVDINAETFAADACGSRSTSSVQT